MKKNVNILLAYFSATDNTRKIAEVIEKELQNLKVNVTVYDVTPKENRSSDFSLAPFDAIFFGFPTYSIRAPRICREWLEELDGEGKKCSIFFTYGGFEKQGAHYYTRKLLTKQNFEVVSTADFLGAHAFNNGGWQAAEERPDQSDYEVAKEYTLKTLKRFTGEDSDKLRAFELPKYSEEDLDQAEKFRFKKITQRPTRLGKSCSLCMLCEKVCPNNSMDAIRGEASPDACIACMACVAHCPENALHINDLTPAWPQKLALHKTTKDEIAKYKSKIYL